ncbi:hypothetical protein BZG01_16500 [Labilibaculum manganireducens]|uniref:Uncharacterized protein n=1 Tax=Labilibaculum manganireducens TaxID=1940525 RepID=A0A2N3HYA4_9BACT|nr:efflux RND transporter periplasmic adaptor subunit [Labilibaculum manganireducens]PKQ62983.1 hypothetical protein BZG01_16500 [Labilibaculum manganireducens]
MRKIILTLFVGCAVLSCGQDKKAQSEQESSPVGTRVKIAMAEEMSEEQILNYTGVTEPILSVPLSFQLPGEITEINFEEGDHILKGQAIAVLNKTSYQSAYSAALAMQKQAIDAYNRMKSVYDNGSLPEIKWEEVKSKLEQANSAAQIARQNLDNCTITAPFTGIIGTRNIEVGSNAIPGITAFNLISMKTIYARISVPENEINQIEKNQTAKVTLSALGDKKYDGKVLKIGVIANTISKTYEVKIKLENNNLEIKPGMVCTINLPLQNTTSNLLIPIQSAMQDEFQKNYVYVVNKETRKVNRKYVQISGIINNKLCVSSGLKSGDWYVTEGVQKLSNNTIVNFK